MGARKYVSPSDMPKLYMEKRKADGSLDFSEPQPPFSACSENQITDYYFRHAPKEGPLAPTPSAWHHDNQGASMETIYKWYSEQGFKIRPKTW